MKSLTGIALGILLFSCTSTTSEENQDGEVGYGMSVRTDTVYVVRNSEITPANAYSDLFLDSAVVEQYIASSQLGSEEQKTFRSFYNYRNGQFAWFSSQGFTEQAKGFWNLQDKIDPSSDKALRSKMDTLLNEDTLFISRYDTSFLKTELAITKAFVTFYKKNRTKTQFAALPLEQVIPVRKMSVDAMVDTLLRRTADSTSKNFNPEFVALRNKLQAYQAISKSGGWQPVTINARQIKKGVASPGIVQLKKRLQKSGDYNSTDTSTTFGDSLLLAVQAYQADYGMKSSGVVTDTLIRHLNVPVEKRLQQMAINMIRMQWMPLKADENFISVNIPSYLLTVYEGKTKVFDMPVAVGKQGTNTTMFTGNLDQIVFSPYWNIPASIVKNEILPKMKADPNYLKSRNMEIVGKNDSLPRIRQLPGKDNSLGKVKFLFPNRYDIYFHDTYAKEVFSKEKRAVSHGCIRLADAEKLAAYLLRSNSSWTPEKINKAMNAGIEEYVKVSPPMAVVITYYTAWVDENGKLNFRDDLYLNDARVGQMLFDNPVVMNTGATTDTSVGKNKPGTRDSLNRK